ncbi:glutathione peroxidase [bacterium]|nr:glutathione peroxidase [bacterium]
MRSILTTLFLFITIMTAMHAQDAQNVYDFTMTTIDGEEKALSDYRGDVLLIVNTASKCGFTPQYEGLQELNERYADRGLHVLGFPANNFGGQEPGSDAQIQEFCSTTYHVTFDMFSKISVAGEDKHPLYAYLTGATDFPGEIKWNFTKFLVDREGRVVARFETKVDPLDEAVTAAIEHALGE